VSGIGRGAYFNSKRLAYYFDAYVGYPPNQARVRKSLRTADPKKARWLWEQEYKKEWEKYYGIKADLPSMAITGAVHEDSDVPMVRENAPLKSRPITA
jgi:hypothetical protein